jgi:hypothetical protein
MTALSAAHAGKPDLKHPDRFFATTIRLRSEGTDHLLAAAEAADVSHVVAQSFGAFNGIREGGWVKTEEDPMDPGPASARKGTEALGHLEDVVVKAGGGPALRQLVRAGRHRRLGRARAQAAVPAGRGRRRLHILGVSRRRGERYRAGPGAKATGVFNNVDDEPAPASEWLPYLAACPGAKRPVRVPK